MAGSASAFAGTVQRGIVPNCSQRIGAVTTPHAAEMPDHLDERRRHRIALVRGGAGAAA